MGEGFGAHAVRPYKKAVICADPRISAFIRVLAVYCFFANSGYSR
jgi:hypothetical protein